MGTPFNRLMNGLGIPILQHVLDALYEGKAIEGMNRGRDKDGRMQVSAVELDGREVKVVFQNPLAQAQRISEVEDVVSSVETCNSVMPPEMVAGTVGLHHLPRYMKEKLNLPRWFDEPEQERSPLAEQAQQTLVAGTGAGPAGGPRAGNDAAGTSVFSRPEAP